MYTFVLIIKASNKEAAQTALRNHPTFLDQINPEVGVEFTQTADEEMAIKGQTLPLKDPTDALNDWYAESNEHKPPYPNGTLLMWTTKSHEPVVAASPPRSAG